MRRRGPFLFRKGDIVQIKPGMLRFAGLVGVVEDLESESPYDVTLDRYQVRLSMTQTGNVFWATQLIKQKPADSR